MCTTAQEVEAELGTVADGATRRRVWWERINPKVSGDARETLLAIAGESLRPEQKYELLRQGAAECGVPNYECEAIRKLLAADVPRE